MKAAIVSLAFFLVFFGGGEARVFAQEDQKYAIEFEEVNPADRGEYFIKRFKEKLSLAFLSFLPERKANYFHKLVKARFSELVNVSENKDLYNFEKSSQRYYTTVGQAVTYVKEKNFGVKRDILETLGQHEKIIESLLSEFTRDSAPWLFLKHDYDYIKTYKTML